MTRKSRGHSHVAKVTPPKSSGGKAVQRQPSSDRRSALNGLGARLRLLLDEREWSATDLAKASGVRLPSITRALRGERTIDLRTALRITQALEISLDHLLDFNPNSFGTGAPGTPSALDRGPEEIAVDVKRDIREMAQRNHDRLQLLLPRVASLAFEIRGLVDSPSYAAPDLEAEGALLGAISRELSACALEASTVGAVSAALSEFYRSV